MIEDFYSAITQYNIDLNDYKDNLLAFQESYIDLMIELWDDFIGVPRPEGQETRKASLGTLDTVAPEFPELDSDYLSPSADDFEGLGFPTISTVPLAEANTKSFGIFGLDGD